MEHKAQTHFEGFALLSHLFCEGYPAAHMYRLRGNVRHIQIARFSREIAGFSSACAGPAYPFVRPFAVI